MNYDDLSFMDDPRLLVKRPRERIWPTSTKLRGLAFAVAAILGGGAAALWGRGI